MSRGIYWLASYPKSGNTWVRAFIANLKANHDTPADINELNTGAIASGRSWIEETLGFGIGELSQEEIDQLRPNVYRWCSQQAQTIEYHKIHDAFTQLSDGRDLVPIDATRGALYIIRNPLDVAISFAHHSNSSIDTAINNMSNPTFAFCNSRIKLCDQLQQRLLSWSDHVLSWVNAPQLKRLIVRYEDMITHPLRTFTDIANFLELSQNQCNIKNALEYCSFQILQAQEQINGFKEKTALSANFFRKGIVGDWQQSLSQTQIQRIINDHRQVMQRFGYVDTWGHPLLYPQQTG